MLKRLVCENHLPSNRYQLVYHVQSLIEWPSCSRNLELTVLVTPRRDAASRAGTPRAGAASSPTSTAAWPAATEVASAAMRRLTPFIVLYRDYLYG